jgi:hypothetical protein
MFESFIVADVRSADFTQRTKVIEAILYSENFPLFAYKAKSLMLCNHVEAILYSENFPLFAYKAKSLMLCNHA